MKAYLIARVSTEEQKDALPGQVLRLVDYANRKGMQYELIEFQESAYKGNRNEFKSIIARIPLDQGLIAIVFDKVDRLTRDSGAEEVRYLKKLCESGDIELHFPSDGGLVIDKNSPATDKMRLNLNGVLAQYYSDAISDNVKRRIDQKLRAGEWIGMAPFGYKNTNLPNGKKWVEKDFLKAEAVAFMYELYASGNYSLRIIRRKVEEQYGFLLILSQVEAILKNPFYYGEMRVKGKLYSHKYDRIITERIFEQAQAVREGYAVKPTRYAGLPYAYRGLISCAECGCRITFEKKKGKYVYGHCTQFRRKHSARYVPEEEFTKQLLNVFESISMPEDAYEEISAVFEEERNQAIKNKEQALSQLNAEIEKYNKRIERIYDDYLEDLITKETYERKHKEFLTAQKKLNQKRATFELDQNQHFDAISHLLKLSRNAPKVFKNANFEQKRSLLNLVLSNLELSGKLLRWELKKPFNMMAFCSDNSSWLPGPDSNRQPRS